MGDHTPLAHLEAHQGERWRHKQPESRMRLQQAGQKSSVVIAQAYVFLQDVWRAWSDTEGIFVASPVRWERLW